MWFGQKLFQPKTFPDLPASVSAASPPPLAFPPAPHRRTFTICRPRWEQTSRLPFCSPDPDRKPSAALHRLSLQRLPVVGDRHGLGGTASEAPGKQGGNFGMAGSVGAGCATKPVVPQTPAFYLMFPGKSVTESSLQELPGTWPFGVRPSFRSMASGHAEEESHGSRSPQRGFQRLHAPLACLAATAKLESCVLRLPWFRTNFLTHLTVPE